MDWLIDLAVKAVVFAGMIFVLDALLDDFKLSKGGILPVTLILLVVNFILGVILRIVAFPFNLITLWILSGVFNVIMNVIIMKVTDRYSEQLEISSTFALLISGGALSAANMIYHWVA